MSTEIPTDALDALAAAMTTSEPHEAAVGPDIDDDLPPSPPEALDNQVTLPGGLVDRLSGTVDREAEVRELDGEDEEAIIRVSGNFAKMLDTILQRGVVSIGGQPAKRAVLDRLLSGDRDALLVAVRRVTFGNEMEMTGRCPECGSEQTLSVDLSTDVPETVLDDPIEDSQFTHTCKTGKTVVANLPDGGVHRALAEVKEPNEAVLNSVLLAKTVESINGQPVLSPQQVKKDLSMRERREVIDEINRRTPGPRLSEVKRPCSTCEAEIAVPLSLASLFLL